MTYLINGMNTRAGLRGGGPVGTYHTAGLGVDKVALSTAKTAAAAKAAAIATAKQLSLNKSANAAAAFKAMTDEALVDAANQFTSTNDTINLNLLMKEARSRNVVVPGVAFTGQGVAVTPPASSNTMLYVGGAALLALLLVARR